jgi:hypothetical protein
MTRLAVLLSGQLVNAIIVMYAIGFWRSANRLPPGPHVVYPELIIIGLGSVIAIDMLVRTLQLLATRGPLPVRFANDDEYRGPTSWPASPVESLMVVLRHNFRIVLMLAATVLMVTLVPRFGFFETAFAFLLVGYWSLGFRRIPQLLLVWSTTSIVIWFFFTRLLVVPQIPRGFLHGILP